MNTDLVLLEQFIKRHPIQAAQTIEGLEDEEIAAFMDEVPVELAVGLLNQMKLYKAVRCLRKLPDEQIVDLLGKMDLQKVELLLRQVDEELRVKWLNGMPPKVAAVLRPKLDYPVNSAGALMSPLNILLRQDTMVKEAIKFLKKEKDLVLSSVCVVDADGTLVGLVRLHDLLLASEKEKVSAIMKTDIPKFFADLPLESIKNDPAWYEYPAIPVVDIAGKLIGTIHFEAVQKEQMETGQEMNKRVLETSTALGELYRIGLTAFLQSVSK